MKFPFAGLLFMAAALCCPSPPLASARELLDIWHMPLSSEPPGHTMREPTYPAPGQPVSLWLAANPPGAMATGQVNVQIDGGPGWQQQPLTFELQAGGHDYWLAALNQAYPSGTLVRYYFGGQGASFNDTFVYGDNDAFFLTADEQTARDGAFAYVVGEMPTPTPPPTPTSTPTPWITSTPTTTVPPTSTPTPPPATPTPQPSGTPVETPTPTPTAPVPTPTATATPDLPTPTATPPLFTPTASPSPAITPTPTETLTPLPTPASDIGVQLALNDTLFTAGERFLLTVTAWNNSFFAIEENLVVMLDVHGEYWFYPRWTHEVDGLGLAFPAGHTFTDLILDFYWPGDGGSANGILFWGALITRDWSGLVGEFDRVEFGFE